MSRDEARDAVITAARNLLTTMATRGGFDPGHPERITYPLWQALKTMDATPEQCPQRNTPCRALDCAWPDCGCAGE